ncbi:MAG TPA: response regulator transcription factor [Propionibacteriaceae bacterium]|jgi:DNA-binding response OmpR family regulator|nr:response regulator transcription factor [Propionibacteriaceae bacterium]
MGTVILLTSDPSVHSDASAAVRSDHVTVRVADVRAALAAAHATRDALLVIGMGPHGPSGYDQCRQIRAASDLPILVIGPSRDEIDELLAFAAGADDYLASPYPHRVFLARVGALIARAARTHGLVSNERVLGTLLVDIDQRRAFISGAPLHLTRIEFDLLVVLSENPHRVVPRSELLDRVWGPWPGNHHVVEVHLSRLRAKIRAAGGPRIGEAVAGFGYRFGGEASATA